MTVIAAEPATAPIRTEALYKTYRSRRGEVQAVDGIDLEVAAGEFFGLLGPNGAGKSTTIGMLTTTVIPTSGRAFVAGVDVTRHPAQAKRRIGVSTQTNTLDRQLTVRENLYYHGRFFGVSRREARLRADELLEQFALTERATSRIWELSGGLAQRLMIARALVHRPEILFLDEPTSGIDPQTRINLWRILRDLHAAGQTILLTTHYMEEADALCERIAILDHGKVLALGSPAELKTGLGADTVITVTLDAETSGLEDAVAAIPGVRRVEREGAMLRVFANPPGGVLAQLVEAASRMGSLVRDATSLPPSLETVFLSLTGREYRE
ncbi:MAG TPA: ATP-binding cassette domain-containing protein [Mycobacteriales bacterium]|nr:ATP-binding cassette domain-containing protein [Mycobacteriales bacterium]